MENQKMKLVYESPLKEGMIVNGIVKSVQPYGAFVEMENGKVGLLHIENISVARIKTPLERFKIGQNIKVVIKSIDEETNRITLSYKELLGTWQENIKEFNEGDIVTGIARQIEKNKYGENVVVNIKKIIPEKKKIKLTII